MWCAYKTRRPFTDKQFRYCANFSPGITWIAILLISVTLAHKLTLSFAAQTQTYKVNPVEGPKGQGKAKVIGGVADVNGDQFSLDGLDIMEPVAITLVPNDKEQELILTLHKSSWKDAERRASTLPLGFAYFDFRTQGEFGIRVASVKGSVPYRMSIWIGAEHRPEMHSVIVSATSSEPKTTNESDEKESGSDIVLWIIAGTLVAIALFLGIIVFRRQAR